jgi:hypothetical protein
MLRVYVAAPLVAMVAVLCCALLVVAPAMAYPAATYDYDLSALNTAPAVTALPHANRFTYAADRMDAGPGSAGMRLPDFRAAEAGATDTEHGFDKFGDDGLFVGVEVSGCPAAGLEPNLPRVHAFVTPNPRSQLLSS